MTDTVVLTVHDRPAYLASVLESWIHVRGIERWRFCFAVEPSSVLDQQLAVLAMFARRPGITATALVNPHRLGVLENPYQALDRAFAVEGAEFAVLAEDDFVVASDILEYVEVLRERYADDPAVALLSARGGDGHADPAAYRLTEISSFGVWGTWVHRWRGFIRDGWDHDYSTHGGVPGYQAGWDWELNRQLQARGLRCATPAASRCQHIGVTGVHSGPAIFASTQAPHFEPDREPVEYVEIKS